MNTTETIILAIFMSLFASSLVMIYLALRNLKSEESEESKSETENETKGDEKDEPSNPNPA